MAIRSVNHPTALDSNDVIARELQCALRQTHCNSVVICDENSHRRMTGDAEYPLSSRGVARRSGARNR